jgi:hypothetical protein
MFLLTGTPPFPELASANSLSTVQDTTPFAKSEQVLLWKDELIILKLNALFPYG